MKIPAKITDRISISEDNKTVISMRDGYQEYYGVELSPNLEGTRLYKVYRTAAEVKKASTMLDGIPITNNHIEVDVEPTKDEKIGKILTTEIIKAAGNNNKASILIRNKIKLFKKAKYNELSLGYTLDLIDSDIEGMDFEQIDITPHHLAFVEAGRCGKVCKILDKQFNNNNPEGDIMTEAEMKKKISDMEEAHKKEVDDLNGTVKDMQETVKDMEKTVSDMEVSKNDAELKAKEAEDENEVTEKVKKAGDAAVLKFKDSAEFSTAVKDSAKQRSEIIVKAKHFLKDDYKFGDKTDCEIIKDAVDAEKGNLKLQDSEYPTAFKLLKVIDANPHYDNEDLSAGGAYDKAVDGAFADDEKGEK